MSGICDWIRNKGLIHSSDFAILISHNVIHTFGISRIINLRYLTHCKSVLQGFSHTKFTVQLE